MNKELTEQDIKNAFHYWSAICEGVPANFGINAARELESKGLLENVLPVRRRGYSKSWTAIHTDLLEEVVKERFKKEYSMLDFAREQPKFLVGTITADGNLIGEE